MQASHIVSVENYKAILAGLAKKAGELQVDESLSLTEKDEIYGSLEFQAGELVTEWLLSVGYKQKDITEILARASKNSEVDGSTTEAYINAAIEQFTTAMNARRKNYENKT